MSYRSAFAALALAAALACAPTAYANGILIDPNGAPRASSASAEFDLASWLIAIFAGPMVDPWGAS